MDDLVLTCDQCGHEMRVSVHAMGATGRCAECGAVLEVRADNTRPFDAEADAAEAAAEPAEPAEPAAPPTHCARCGRAFRGDWDRNPAPERAVCLVCHRLVREDDPVYEEAPVGELAPESSLRLDQGAAPVRPMDRKAPVPQFAQGHPKLFRGALWTLAVLVIALAIVFTFVDTGGMPERSEEEYAAAARRLEASGIGQVVWWVLVPLMFVFGFGAHGVTLAVVLYYTGRLPGDGFVQNLILLTPSALVLAGLALMQTILLMAPFPFNLILVGLVGIVYVYHLWCAWDLSLGCLVTYLFVHPLTTAAVAMVSAVVYGVIGWIVL